MFLPLLDLLVHCVYPFVVVCDRFWEPVAKESNRMDFGLRLTQANHIQELFLPTTWMADSQATRPKMAIFVRRW
jgi:hypothetical protein